MQHTCLTHVVHVHAARLVDVSYLVDAQMALHPLVHFLARTFAAALEAVVHLDAVGGGGGEHVCV